MAKHSIDENQLEEVVGGLMRWNYRNQIMTYTREDGTITAHTINDFDKAWARSNELHGKNYHEDTILQMLLDEGLINA